MFLVGYRRDRGGTFCRGLAVFPARNRRASNGINHERAKRTRKAGRNPARKGEVNGS